jgi:hypothetical protein
MHTNHRTHRDQRSLYDPTTDFYVYSVVTRQLRNL